MKKTSIIALFICLSGVLINTAMAIPGKKGGALPADSAEKLSQSSATSSQSSTSATKEEDTK